jgi:hypothetical protein
MNATDWRVAGLGADMDTEISPREADPRDAKRLIGMENFWVELKLDRIDLRQEKAYYPPARKFFGILELVPRRLILYMSVGVDVGSCDIKIVPVLPAFSV